MTGSITRSSNGVALARKFFDSIEAGDIEAVVGCYIDNPVIWHNTDGKEMTLADQVAALGFLDAQYPERRFRNRRVSAFEGGFVQQHIFWGRHLDGHEIEFPACVVCRTRDGRIERLDEYLDSAPFAAPRESRS